MRELELAARIWVPNRAGGFSGGHSLHREGTGAAGIALTAHRLKQGAIAMPKENDLEGIQDQGGKHGGQKGMPAAEPKPPHGPDQGIVRDEKGQEQPRDKERARQVHKTDTFRR
jgi:hypothetical protein